MGSRLTLHIASTDVQQPTRDAPATLLIEHNTLYKISTGGSLGNRSIASLSCKDIKAKVGTSSLVLGQVGTVGVELSLEASVPLWEKWTSFLGTSRSVV